MKRPYDNLSDEQLILRDRLAIDRTILANDRTLLSFIRTSLALIATGAAIIHFLENEWVRAGGVLMAIAGVGLIVLGYIKYRKMGKLIREAKR